MKSRFLTLIPAIALFAALPIPIRLCAQDKPTHNNMHHHYQFIDLGTFGGPQSWALGAGEGPGGALSNAGTVVGVANTPNSNPNYAYPCNPFGSYTCAYFGTQDLFVEHGFRFENGALTDLGVLPGGYNSFVAWISGNGTFVGSSENGVIDPVNGYPEIRAVLWKHGQIKDLGTLEGGNESFAFGVNNRGQIAGFSFDASNHIRAVRWTEDQGIQDLGTLGACCAIAGTINELGQISGESGLCDTCNQDAFLWEHGQMHRIAGFGGPITAHADLNNQGQVVGQSDLPGGQAWHGFLWEKGVLTDLPTLGGCCSGARWINDAGDIVGYAYDQNQFPFAVLWKDGKIKNNIGTVDGDACSLAQNVNSESQVVGLSDMKCDGTVLHAFLWEKGGPAVDLNTLVSPGSGLQLTYATDINDRGEIAGEAITSNGDNHGFLLIPCDGNHPGVEGCDYSPVDTSVLPQVPASPDAPSRTSGHAFQLPRTRSPFGNRILGRTPVRNGIDSEGQAGQLRNTGDLLPDTLDGLGPLCFFRCCRGCSGTGYCTLDSNNKLTGTCFGRTLGSFQCASKFQPVQCPVGKQAIRPANFSCSIGSIARVEAARSCTD